jgi:hypothetical protein
MISVTVFFMDAILGHSVTIGGRFVQFARLKR